MWPSIEIQWLWHHQPLHLSWIGASRIVNWLVALPLSVGSLIVGGLLFVVGMWLSIKLELPTD